MPPAVERARSPTVSPVGEGQAAAGSGLGHDPLRDLPPHDRQRADSCTQQPRVGLGHRVRRAAPAESPGVERGHQQHPAHGVQHIVGGLVGVVEADEVAQRVEQERRHQQHVRGRRIGPEAPPPRQRHYHRRQHEQREPEGHALALELVQRHGQRHHEGQRQRDLHPDGRRHRSPASVQTLGSYAHRVSLFSTILLPLAGSGCRSRVNFSDSCGIGVVFLVQRA